MDIKEIPVSLNIAMTPKAIEFAFRKSIATTFPLELPAESFVIACFHQGIIQQDIAKMAKKDKSAVLRQIDMLENKGLVQRQSNRPKKEPYHCYK